MSQTASQRPKRVFLIVFAIAVVGVIAFAGWRLTGDDDPADPLATGKDSTTTPTAATSTPTTTATPKKPKSTASCEGPDTQFNVEGIEQDSLLPDCGTTPVTHQQEQKSASASRAAAPTR